VARAALPRRLPRPTRWANEAGLPGGPIRITLSTLPMSMPSSSVLLAKQIALSAAAYCASISRRRRPSMFE